MIAKQLISSEIPALSPTDSGLKALSRMDEFRVAHLPVVEKSKYLGLISDTEIWDFPSPDEQLRKQRISYHRISIFFNQHFYEAIRVLSETKLTLLPVLDESERYRGVITLGGLVQKLGNITAVKEPGGVIVLELNTNDYSLSQIAQIVEGDNAKILSLYIASHPDSTKLEVTLKVNKTSMSGIIQTFNRYNYAVKSSFGDNTLMEDLKDRYDSLMNYLKI